MESHTISAVFTKAGGLPNYLDSSGVKVLIGFAENKVGEMKYIVTEEKTVLFTSNHKSFTTSDESVSTGDNML